MRKFEQVDDEHLQYEDKVSFLPKRATKNSAGYDFFSPIDLTLKPQENKIIWTNIKAQMNDDEVLMLYVTSKMGKHPVVLSNGTGVIDGDYYSNESNDGNLGIRLFNMGETNYDIKKGDKIGQGVFLKFLTVDEEDIPTEKRVGGYGSTSASNRK